MYIIYIYIHSEFSSHQTCTMLSICVGTVVVIFADIAEAVCNVIPKMLLCQDVSDESIFWALASLSLPPSFQYVTTEFIELAPFFETSCGKNMTDSSSCEKTCKR